MLQSRWQLAVSDKPIHVNSNLNGCYAVAAASDPASTDAYRAAGVYNAPVLRQDWLHVGSTFGTTISTFDSLLMEKGREGKPAAASRSQALIGLRKRRRIEG